MKKFQHETNPSVLKSAIVRQTMKRTKAQGSVTFPAIPGLVDDYTNVMSHIWTALNRAPTSTELAYFRDCLAEQLEAAFDDSPYSKVVVVYDTNPPPQTNLMFRIDVELASIDSEYADWVAHREPPLFGLYPDAKVMNQTRIVETYTLKDPSEIRILDVGAGTGRNTIPLAALGYRVDACEPSKPLMKQLVERVNSECSYSPVGLFDVEFSKLNCIPNYYDFVFLSEVVSHFRSINQLGKVFEIASTILKPGGFLLFNTFVAKDGYTPSDLVIQASEVNWSRVFTRSELRLAASRIQSPDGMQSGIWNLESDESTLEYEKTHQDASQWPPTGWFEHWVQGRDAFDLPAAKCPYEMHWLCYRKAHSSRLMANLSDNRNL